MDEQGQLRAEADAGPAAVEAGVLDVREARTASDAQVGLERETADSVDASEKHLVATPAAHGSER
jgi:hypothetical protein